jgi:hypothetical protein
MNVIGHHSSSGTNLLAQGREHHNICSGLLLVMNRATSNPAMLGDLAKENVKEAEAEAGGKKAPEYRCEECGMEFASKEELDEHLMEHETK